MLQSTGKYAGMSVFEAKDKVKNDILKRTSDDTTSDDTPPMTFPITIFSMTTPVL